ncbi:unnamed protein product, partial [Ixodes persulcatus]
RQPPTPRCPPRVSDRCIYSVLVFLPSSARHPMAGRAGFCDEICGRFGTSFDAWVARDASHRIRIIESRPRSHWLPCMLAGEKRRLTYRYRTDTYRNKVEYSGGDSVLATPGAVRRELIPG